MTHTVEIADSKGKTMQLSVSVDTLGFGGSWRSLTKGMIKHNSGPIHQYKIGWSASFDVGIMAGGYWGIKLGTFISWGTVNDEGTGTIEQAWVIGLEPGNIEWSIV